jgi:hypothetical protein
MLELEQRLIDTKIQILNRLAMVNWTTLNYYTGDNLKGTEIEERFNVTY